nr:putative reverse transcriptase domain-containing protein [Tanacetum cinerariifolium]
MNNIMNPRTRGDRNGRSSEEIVSGDVGVNLVFKDELEMGDDVFVLIGEEVTEGSEIPEAMFPLIEEFFDVFLDELPDALPPLCNIHHHIDLKPSSQLPNKRHYSLCPGEHEELRRQVEEFVSNGYIRKIMSTCTQPRGPLDLISLYVSSSVPKRVHDFIAGLHDIHKAVRDNLVCANCKYKQDADQKRRHVDLEVGDFVWAVLTNDRFPVGEYNKLSAKKIGPLEIMEKMNLNAYCLKLPSHIRCLDVFNVKHLLPYHGDSSDEDAVGNLRMNFVYPGENDVNPKIVSGDVGVNLVFKDELEMGDDVFVLIGEEVTEGSEIPEAMFPLIEEFFDVFLDELPDALPPLCNIHHHIDLEPSSQLPNKRHYRLCPGEHEELRRQVEEFVSNGYIRKIMSTCTQPRGPLDLISLHDSSSVPKRVHDFIAGLHDVQKAVRDNLVCANSKYKQDADQKRRHVDLEVGDFVWAVLTNDHFPVGEYNKLSAKKIGPLEIGEKMNLNAYCLKLPSHIRCLDVFNVKHLLPYHGDSFDEDAIGNLWMNFVYPGENDVNPSIKERALLFLEAQDRVKEKA